MTSEKLTSTSTRGSIHTDVAPLLGIVTRRPNSPLRTSRDRLNHPTANAELDTPPVDEFGADTLGD